MSNSPQAPAYQALYRACMKEAALRSDALMQRVVVRAGKGLQQSAKAAPDQVHRTLLSEAERTLVKHAAALSHAYPAALLAEFAQALAGDPRNSGTLSFDSLQSMGDEQVRENVELMRMQEAVSAQVQAQLTQLNALISSVQGLESVQPDRNPLRPEVYLRSLRTVSLKSPIPAHMRARWISHLGDALGPELAVTYAELAAWMKSKGVTEARYSGEPSTPAASGSLLNLDELRKLLASDAPDSGKQEAPLTAFGATMPAAVDALENMTQVDAVVRRLKDRQPTEAVAPAQLLAQEVVKLMVDNIATDARLLAPVRQCVRDLEPALLRLALADPRFFSDRQHPARGLLDEMAQRSLAWETEQSTGFKAFVDPLQQAVEALRTTQATGAEPFDFALGMLREAWSDPRQSDGRQREKAVRALLRAEQRNLLARKIATGMRNRPDLQSAPQEIVAFVAGPWAQVMAQARLADTSGAPDAGGYTSVVTDLVWSAQPHVVGKQTGRLLKLAPVLMEKLREGLAGIGYAEAATQRFLDYLAHAHRIALHSLDGNPSQVAALSRDELEAMMGEAEAAGIWLAPKEAQHSGFMDTDAGAGQKAPAVKTDAPAHDAAGDVPQADLQPGSWVEMADAGRWTRYRVMWTSPHGTLFMFFGASGQPKSMTRMLLEKMLRDGTLRLVSAQAVVDGALDAVAQAALRNSVYAKL
jgi:hypothetical protein